MGLSFSTFNPLNSAANNLCHPGGRPGPRLSTNSHAESLGPDFRRDDRIYLNQFNKVIWFRQLATREKICESKSGQRR